MPFSKDSEMQTYLATRSRLNHLAKNGLQSTTRDEAQRKLDQLSETEHEAALRLEAFKNRKLSNDSPSV